MPERRAPDWILAARRAWDRSPRPDNIEVPGPGQESVWDYPRPPRLESVSKRIRVEHAGAVIANTVRAQRVCETASAPTYYVPTDDVDRDLLVPLSQSSHCEWKGEAAYFDVVVDGARSAAAAWCYPKPYPEFDRIAGWIAFMPQRVDACWVGEDRVTPQPGGFYGGWVTPELTGPIKGAPGTGHW